MRSSKITFVRVFCVYYHFYRAMHVAQSAVLLSYVVRPSACLSVTLMYREHWTTSKLITRIISLGSSLLGATTSAM